MKVNLDELKNAIFSMWVKKTDKANAEFIAENTIETAMRKGTRVNPVISCLEDYKKYDTSKSIIIENEAISMINYNFNGQPVIPFIKEIIENAVMKAKQTGIYLVGLHNSAGVHELDSWTIEVAKRDCLGMFTFNGGPYCTVPFGSMEPFFGTNPMSFGFPTSTDQLLFDGATSEIALFDARNAVCNKTPLKENCGLDRQGKKSTVASDVFDPEKETDCRLLPMGGGAKGSAIMLMLELLTGMVGGKIGRESSDVWKGEEFGGMLIVIDPSKFGKVEQFKARTSLMCNEIRNSKPAHGFDKVRLPGDLALDRRQECLNNNLIEVKEEVWEEIEKLTK